MRLSDRPLEADIQVLDLSDVFNAFSYVRICADPLPHAAPFIHDRNTAGYSIAVDAGVTPDPVFALIYLMGVERFGPFDRGTFTIVRMDGRQPAPRHILFRMLAGETAPGDGIPHEPSLFIGRPDDLRGRHRQ